MSIIISSPHGYHLFEGSYTKTDRVLPASVTRKHIANAHLFRAPSMVHLLRSSITSPVCYARDQEDALAQDEGVAIRATHVATPANYDVRPLATLDERSPRLQGRRKADLCHEPEDLYCPARLAHSSEYHDKEVELLLHRS